MYQITIKSSKFPCRAWDSDFVMKIKKQREVLPCTLNICIHTDEHKHAHSQKTWGPAPRTCTSAMRCSSGPGVWGLLLFCGQFQRKKCNLHSGTGRVSFYAWWDRVLHEEEEETERTNSLLNYCAQIHCPSPAAGLTWNDRAAAAIFFAQSILEGNTKEGVALSAGRTGTAEPFLPLQ